MKLKSLGYLSEKIFTDFDGKVSEHTNIKTIVMCADPDYHAAQIYKNVGFKPAILKHGKKG